MWITTLSESRWPRIPWGVAKNQGVLATLAHIRHYGPARVLRQRLVCEPPTHFSSSRIAGFMDLRKAL